MAGIYFSFLISMKSSLFLAALSLPLLGLSVTARAQAPAAAPALMATALRVGDQAPAFNAKDANGRPVELRQLLKNGPVVLCF